MFKILNCLEGYLLKNINEHLKLFGVCGNKNYHDTNSVPFIIGNLLE